MVHHIDFVGIAHLGENTESLLKNAFETINPNVMSVEYPSDQKGYQDFWASEEMQKKRAEITREIEGLGIQGLPEDYESEIGIMQKIFEESGTPLICIDSLKAKIIIEQRNDYIETLRELSVINVDEVCRVFEEHINTGQISKQLLFFLESMKEAFFLTPERETFQQDKLKDIQKRWKQHNDDEPMRLMHVGGIGHLADVEEVTTLYRLIKNDPDFEIHRHSLRFF